MAVTVNCGSPQSRTGVPGKEEAPSSTRIDDGAPEASTVLLDAAYDGQAELVREALERGADPSVKGEDGRTALMLAAFDGHTDTLRVLLVGGAPVDDRDGSGRTALMYAASGPNPESVQLLLDWKAEPNLVDQEERFSALMFAAAEGQAGVVQTLLDHGSDSDLVDVDGDTALDFAARNGHQEVVRLLSPQPVRRNDP